jgi:transposase
MLDEKKKMDNKEEDERLKEEIEKLRKEIERLRKENEALRKAKKKIEKEFEEYKVRHPENVGVKHGKPYHIKEPRITKPHGKPGAKPGHKGYSRKIAEHIDRIIEVPVDICPHCGLTELSKNIQETRTRTVEEIPQCRPIVTLYKIHRRYCRVCKKLVENPVHDALPGATIGIRTMLFTTWLKIRLRMTIEAIPQVLDEAFGLKISEGEVQNILDQMARAFEPYYEQMVEDMRSRPARNIDETGWRIDGDNVWLWAFITKWEAIYHIAATRGHEAALEVLGTTPKGVDIHDRFTAYNPLRRKTGFRPQQVCWSHLLGDSKEIAKLYDDQGGNHIHWVLKQIYKKAMAFNHHGTQEDVEELKATLERWIVRDFASIECRTFVKNLLEYKGFMFEFVTNPDVDATNNRAERAIRPCVIARKVSGGSRSDRGARIYSVLMSVVQTLRQNGKSVLSHGKDILLTSHG